MRKSLISLVLVVVMLLGSAISLTSCFGNDTSYLNEDFVIPEGGYDGSNVEITFYHCSGKTLVSILEKHIAKFNELYPNIKVNLVSQGDYDGVRDIINTNITAGEQPDIAYCYPDHVALYNNSRVTVALNGLINSKIEITDNKGNTTVLGLTDEQIADFIPAYYNEGKVYDDKGTMYTLPMAKSTETLYYNKTFFDEHNLTVPTTWDELEAVCEQIKNIPGCENDIPLGYDSEANWFITMCEQLGSGFTSLDSSNHFLFNNDENKEFVKEFSEWFKKGYVTTYELNGSYTSDLFTEVGEGKKKCYMVIGSTGGASYQNPPVKNTTATNNADKYYFEIGVSPLPQEDVNNPKAISQGPSLCIFKQSNPQRVVASWLLMKYLSTNMAFQAEFSISSGYSPVIKSALEDETYKDWLADANGYNNLQALGVGVCNATSDYAFISPAFKGSSKARDMVKNIVSGAFTATAKYSGDAFDAKIDELFNSAIAECNRAAK